MKRICAIICSIALAGCSVVPTIPASPSTLANTTTLDEKAASTPELLYSAFLVAGNAAVDAGLVKGQAATQLASIYNSIYFWVTKARDAYKLGNAADYNSAMLQLNALIAVGNSIIGAHK